MMPSISLQWRHNERDGVSNHQPHDCLLNRLFRNRSKKTSKLPITGLCEGNSPVNSPHKGPVMRYDVFAATMMFNITPIDFRQTFAKWTLYVPIPWMSWAATLCADNRIPTLQLKDRTHYQHMGQHYVDRIGVRWWYCGCRYFICKIFWIKRAWL